MQEKSRLRKAFAEIHREQILCAMEHFHIHSVKVYLYSYSNESVKSKHIRPQKNKKLQYTLSQGHRLRKKAFRGEFYNFRIKYHNTLLTNNLNATIHPLRIEILSRGIPFRGFWMFFPRSYLASDRVIFSGKRKKKRRSRKRCCTYENDD